MALSQVIIFFLQLLWYYYCSIYIISMYFFPYKRQIIVEW